MLCVLGNLKIGDFGLAVPYKLWGWDEGDGGYLALELLQEEDPSPKADIYSYGAMAYEWVTGAQPPRTRPAGEDIPECRPNAARRSAPWCVPCCTRTLSSDPARTRLFCTRRAGRSTGLVNLIYKTMKTLLMDVYILLF